MKGLCGRLIRVNLTDGSIGVENIEDEVARKYIGGKGLAAYYAIREIKKGTDPLGPENKLYLFTGALTGTPAPLGNRTVAATKSPLTHTFTDSYMGGFWGPELKFAGYDGIILEGASAGARPNPYPGRRYQDHQRRKPVGQGYVGNRGRGKKVIRRYEKAR